MSEKYTISTSSDLETHLLSQYRDSRGRTQLMSALQRMCAKETIDEATAVLRTLVVNPEAVTFDVDALRSEFASTIQDLFEGIETTQSLNGDSSPWRSDDTSWRGGEGDDDGEGWKD